jgi:HD-GYP domain-containing protein (c-di-GMP phosphodiesterase class II)
MSPFWGLFVSEIFAAVNTLPTDDALVELARESDTRHVERPTPLLLAGGFLAVATALAFLPWHRGVSAMALVVSLVAYAVARRIEVEFTTYWAIPTEAVFVVMWFVLPLPLLPLVVCGAMVAGGLPEIVRGGRAADRAVVLSVASCWHAIGPTLVLYYAGIHQPRWEDAGFYAAALASQFLLDLASTYALTRSVARVSLLAHVRNAVPAYGFDAVLAPLGLLAAFPSYRHPEAMLLLLPMVFLVERIGRERAQKHDADLALKNAYQGTSYLLGDMIEADDAYTGGHSRDVVRLVQSVAAKLGLDGNAATLAEFTALLHDVGKLKVPGALLNKTGPLEPEERALMETHTILGEEMLERAGGLLAQVAPFIRSSHERWDGAGYPDGLAGEEIPLLARIVAVCDAWSAMTSDRAYRRALSREEAAAELRRGAGTQFDPAVVEALQSVLDL